MLQDILLVVLLALTAGAAYFAWQWRAQLLAAQAELSGHNARQDEIISARDAIITERDQALSERERIIDEKNQLLLEKDKRVLEREAALDEQASHASYQRALMLTLANAAYEALLVVDQDQRIIASNNAAEALFEQEQPPLGQLLLDVTGAPELNMMVSDAVTNEEALLEEQITLNSRNYRVRIEVIRRDGHYFVALALQDITQLVRLNRARRDMVANISHELRTPIANIRLIIDGLFHDQDKPKRKDSISSLRAIARETDNLLWLVQEMSDLAMIESGQAIVRMVEVPLFEVVDESMERMADQSELKQIKLVRHVPEKLQVLCDRDLAQRVLVNLIHNALKWSPPNEAVTISAVNGGDEVTISVLDNGPGVPEDMVDRIFERFYQLDPSRSGGEGTGLGLAICRHIVEAHGGRIWAESNKDGTGGRFMFTLLSAGGYSEDDLPDDTRITPGDVDNESA